MSVGPNEFKKKVWMEGGWDELYRSNFFLDFLNLF